jgi:hypothetical protein
MRCTGSQSRMNATSTSGARCFMLALAALAVSPGVTSAQDIAFLSPSTPIVFGAMPVFVTSGSITVTLRNDDTSTHSISSLAITGANPGDFQLNSGSCVPATLMPNGTCNLSVSFTPTSTGARSAQLNVTHDGSGSPSTAGLQGDGVFTDIWIQAPGVPIVFATTQVGAQSANVAITVFNSGSGTVTISSASITGSNASDFTIVSPCSSPTLPPGGTCVIIARFQPTAAGTRTAGLSLTHSGAGSPSVPQLRGTALPPPTTTTTTTTTLPVASVDNFNCYKVKDLKNPPLGDHDGVSLTDQFGTGTVDVKKIAMVCAPADKDGSGISDPLTHLCCYKVKSAKLDPAPRAQIADEFGSLQVEVKQSGMLCQPCSKALLP